MFELPHCRSILRAADQHGAGRIARAAFAPLVACSVAMTALACAAHREVPAGNAAATSSVAAEATPTQGPAPAAPVSSAAQAGLPVATRVLDTGQTIAGEALAYPKSALPQVTSQIVTILPGQTTGWHRHGVPTFGYVLSGHLEVEYESKLGRRVLGPGDSLMEAMHVAHDATNLAAEPVRILVVFMGAQGRPTVLRADPPAMPAGIGGTRTADLVDLASVDPRLRFDIRYAGAGNFTGRPVYTSARAFLEKPAAEALRRANDRARKEGFGLLVLDAYRPWSVTRMFWDNYPMHRAYLADPLQGSRHNRGCAVDLTLFDLHTGAEVKMPSAYDDFSEKAHPSYAEGSAAERAARDRLRAIMEAEGFSVYENEWWHFDYRGWQEYPVLDFSFDEVARSASRRGAP